MSSFAETKHSPTILRAFEGTMPVETRPAKSDKHRRSHTESAKSRRKARRAQEPKESSPERRINWPVTAWLAILHLGAIAAFWTFTWQAVILTVFLHWISGGLGICLGYHRYLTHGSFQTTRPMKMIMALMGGLAGEGSSIDWVANHRQHHAHSDQPGDPHSPHDGPWWSHMFWLAYTLQGEERDRHVRRWAPDLARDPDLVFMGQMFLPSHFILGAILFGCGYLLAGWPMAWSFMVYGIFARLVFVLHSTWFVNSASHMWGYKNYETTDDSRNNWWVALLTYGEGWHNNHHAYPRMAPHGHRWWEFDVTFQTIRLMRAVGLAWDVVDYKQKTLGGAEGLRTNR